MAWNPNLGILQQYEGFSQTPYDDWSYRAGTGERYNSGQRIGYGQTYDPSMDGWTPEQFANALPVREGQEYYNEIARHISPEALARLTPDQQGVLVSLVHNYGRIDPRLVPALRTGDAAQIAAGIEALANDNQGINRNRRLGEAGFFRGTGTTTPQGGGINPNWMAYAGNTQQTGAGAAAAAQGAGGDGQGLTETDLEAIYARHPILARMAGNQERPILSGIAGGILERARRGEGLLSLVDRAQDRREENMASGNTLLQRMAARQAARGQTQAGSGIEGLVPPAPIPGKTPRTTNPMPVVSPATPMYGTKTPAMQGPLSNPVDAQLAYMEKLYNSRNPPTTGYGITTGSPPPDWRPVPPARPVPTQLEWTTKGPTRNGATIGGPDNDPYYEEIYGAPAPMPPQMSVKGPVTPTSPLTEYEIQRAIAAKAGR